ncbi:DDB1- and CUL4-associated factor 11 [Teleopsis dalmanni]|uniref:DDB1- and CUL4-associated factor 11 n=1 Tax=Teleopsis dalmanni TaxID=139649 RepID=UPI0018CF4E2E|nr:DDB1- and CUL4-associated factor 11 [Teleopsis dalmanni]
MGNIAYEVSQNEINVPLDDIDMNWELHDRLGFLRNIFFDTAPRNHTMPKIRKKPCLTHLRNSDIYKEVKAMCGLPANSKLPSSKWSLNRAIEQREMGLKGRPFGAFSANDQRRIATLFIPNKKIKKLMSFENKVQVCTFNKDGSRLVTVCNDHFIRIFDASKGTYHRVNKMKANFINLHIVDLDISSCGGYVAYSTWSDLFCVLPINGSPDDLKMIDLNVNETRFGVFSLRFSPDGKKLVGGCSNARVYLCDRETDTITYIQADHPSFVHINAISYVDELNPNLLLTGSNHGLLKLWDMRTVRNNKRDGSVCTFYGHLDGITYIDSRNDGRHVLSNSKDQSIKLWDLRKSTNKSKIKKNFHLPVFCWDYRWDSVPRELYNCKPREGDVSLMTYRGHRVTKTLLRAKFSPLLQTGQRYIYTGCSTGRIIVYDLLTGNIKEAIEGHWDVVRDLSWHPVRPEIISGSWDFHVNLNAYKRDITLNKMSVFPKLRRSIRIAEKKVHVDVADMSEDDPYEDW